MRGSRAETEARVGAHSLRFGSEVTARPMRGHREIAARSPRAHSEAKARSRCTAGGALCVAAGGRLRCGRVREGAGDSAKAGDGFAVAPCMWVGWGMLRVGTHLGWVHAWVSSPLALFTTGRRAVGCVYCVHDGSAATTGRQGTMAARALIRHWGAVGAWVPCGHGKNVKSARARWRL